MAETGKNGKIPLIAGVTGHRDLREQDIGILKEAFRSEIGSLQKKYPYSEVAVMTGLAEGADQLCAETALEMGLEIISVLPVPLEEYAGDFEGEALKKLHELAAKSSKVLVAPHREAFRGGRNYLYRQAGIYISEHCHVLIALWDGAEDEGEGCGTAAIVQTKLRNVANGAAGDQLRKTDGAVIQIVTPRRESGSVTAKAGKVMVHGDIASTNRILSDTDFYNKDCENSMSGSSSEDKVDAVYTAADQLSMQNDAINKRVLIILSTCATVLTIAFLLYDEAEWHWMILLVGMMIIALFAINTITDRLRLHERYTEYRILAESCRVQNYLRTAGIRCEVTDIMPWNLQVTLPWVSSALSAIMIGEEPGEKKSIMDIWIAGQKDYQKKALKRTEAQLKRNDWIVSSALVVTILTYVAALLYEIICCGLILDTDMFSPEVDNGVRTAFKICLGAFSAITLFANNYYGRLALPNVIDDHRKMALLYEEAEREIADKGEAEPLLMRIAEDELSENANWYAYQSKHGADLGI